MAKPREILVLTSSLINLMYPALIRFARSRGWQVMLQERHNPPEDWHGDGIILMLLDNQEMKRFITAQMAAGVPVVDLLDAVKSIPLPRVLSDYAASAKLAASHFRKCGFHHSAFFAMEHTEMHETLYEHFARATRGEAPIRWIWSERTINPNNRAALTSWTRRMIRTAPKPIAVWCFNDYNAAYFTDICLKCGVKIPQEIAILGHGDNSMHTETAAIPLSSVAINWERRMRTACSLLERLMNGGAAPEKPILIKPTGISVRESTDGMAIEDRTLRTAIYHATNEGATPCGVEQVARRMNLSRRALNAISRKELGKSLHSAIVKERIRKAKRMLADGNMKLSAIASDLGFCNASYLIKVFRRETGMTPTKWRLKA